MDNNFKGKLLVAKPHVMRDPFFQKSVVYIYEQQGEVVLGLILNKPTKYIKQLRKNKTSPKVFAVFWALSDPAFKLWLRFIDCH